jgi:hypothetical protein
MTLHVLTKLRSRKRHPAARVGASILALAVMLAAASSKAAPPQGPAISDAGPQSNRTGPEPTTVRPWVEGVDPFIENRLFYATYGALRNHNVLKVYAFSAGGYESAGIRFSGRVPHEQRDLTVAELSDEAATLIRTTFDGFPEVQELDVWATIPVAQIDQTSVESTVFSVSADRETYERLARRTDLTDAEFIQAFGRVWVAPQVPR